jgi:hypothetical protein
VSDYGLEPAARESSCDYPHSVLHWYDFACPFCYVGQSRDRDTR